jgi:Cysteine rich repeat
MAQQQSSSGTMAGVVTIFGLGLVWLTVAMNFPSQEELSSAALPVETRQAPGSSLSLSAPPIRELTTSDALPPGADNDRSHDPSADAPVMTRVDPSALQVIKLKCEADIEQLCPDSADGTVRTRCLKQRGKQLPPVCQSQLHERFVKWKEDRSRLMAACNEDVKRFCRAVKPGSGQILQCLQSHDQEVSDRCYATLPKDTFFFK